MNLFISGSDKVSKYWTKYNITSHHNFSSIEDSLDFLEWRNACYLYYSDLMPTNEADNLVVLDYGCGPGHDLVSFSINSNPERLIGADVSSTSLEEARNRLALHQKKCEFINLSAVKSGGIPLEDKSVDLIHCSGVLHHLENPETVLKEFRRIIKPKGKMQIMVYNYDSIWVHLYVAYELMIEKPETRNKILSILNLQRKQESLTDFFRRSTDGRLCPVSRFYKKDDFLRILQESEFSAVYKGASISQLMELNRLNKRFSAITNKHLPKEHRDFLNKLTFNAQGVPIYEGVTAGIGGCYSAIPK